MSDLSPESASARDVGSPAGDSSGEPDSPAVEPWFAAPTDAPAAPDPGPFPPVTPRQVRRIRGPLIGFVAGAAVVALGLGGYLIAHNASASRSNTPVAKSSHVQSGGITVTGHGITMIFPAGWVNVPTSPNQFRQYIKNLKGHIPAALRADANDPQLVSSLAMLVYRPSAHGSFDENMNALVFPLGPAPTQMMAQLKSGQIQGPALFGATDVQYSVTYFGPYPGVLVTYSLRVQGVTVYGAQSYLNTPTSTVVTTVTSQAAATSDSDLLYLVDTISFT
jgi:hypothetical protein